MSHPQLHTHLQLEAFVGRDNPAAVIDPILTGGEPLVVESAPAADAALVAAPDAGTATADPNSPAASLPTITAPASDAPTPAAPPADGGAAPVGGLLAGLSGPVDAVDLPADIGSDRRGDDVGDRVSLEGLDAREAETVAVLANAEANRPAFDALVEARAAVRPPAVETGEYPGTLGTLSDRGPAQAPPEFVPLLLPVGGLLDLPPLGAPAPAGEPPAAPGGDGVSADAEPAAEAAPALEADAGAITAEEAAALPVRVVANFPDETGPAPTGLGAAAGLVGLAALPVLSGSAGGAAAGTVVKPASLAAW